MSLARAGEHQAPSSTPASGPASVSSGLPGPEGKIVRPAACLDQSLPSLHTPCQRLQLGKAKIKKLGFAVTEGDFPDFAYLPSYSGSVFCCTQPSSPATSLRDPHGQLQLQTTTSSIHTPHLTQWLWLGQTARSSAQHSSLLLLG